VLGVSINKAMDGGVTPLNVTAQNAREAVVRALIEAGAIVNKAMKSGSTLLYVAAQEGNEAVVRALIEADADVNKARNDGERPLSVSEKPVLNDPAKEFAAITQMLRDAGAV
tara:strand:+ start:15249 stop:15584 length:336 start_codon:yes stop_codon:yes gene_type:complete